MSGLATAAFSVLFVGHSLFGALGPDLLAGALSARLGSAEVQAQIINGAPLRYNWDNAETAEGVNGREVLARGDVTHLILTEAIPLANHLRWSDTANSAMNFAGLALKANPTTQVYLQETWHSLNSGTGTALPDDEGAGVAWRQRLRQDLLSWEGIVGDMRKAAPDAAGRITLIPAGQALGQLADEIAAKNVPGIGDISDVFDDDIHLNVLGHYFVSMVQFAVLTGGSPTGLPHKVKDRWGGDLAGPDAAMAAAFQRIAWDAVRGYPGVKLSAVTPKQAAQGQAMTTSDPPAQVFLAQAIATAPQEPMQIGVGLAPITDWSVQQPFLDLMKTARPFIGHLAGQWGGLENEMLQATGYLDAAGWPRSLPPEAGSIGTLTLTDMPEAATDLNGRYLLRFEGTGVVEVAGRAENVRYGTSEVRFDYAPGPGSVDVRIQRTAAADPIRLITVVREDRAGLMDKGQLFNPDWLARISEFDALRFMDWMATNESTQIGWTDRPEPEDATWAQDGVPVELMVALANSLGRDPWFNMPHQADDIYVAAFARYVADTLDPTLTAYVEYSNEVWNWQFGQTAWADAQAQALWGEKEKGLQYYGMRAAEIATIWREAFGASAEARLINVISSQTGWLGLETEVLDAPLSVAMGNARPAEAFDAYAVAGYFGGILGTEARAGMIREWLAESEAAAELGVQGLTEQARVDDIAAHRYDLASQRAAQELLDGAVSGDPNDTLVDLIGRVWPYHAAVAQQNGLALIMYEGGTHIVGIGPQVDDADLTAFFQHFNYTSQMGELYDVLLEGWRHVGGQLFTAYADVYYPTKWGSWGALRHLSDTNPRWDALVAPR